MDRIIYTAMTGANAAAQRQAVLSNNLANATTTGFRAELSTFRAVPLQGDGASTRVFALEATSGYRDDIHVHARRPKPHRSVRSQNGTGQAAYADLYR